MGDPNQYRGPLVPNFFLGKDAHSFQASFDMSATESCPPSITSMIDMGLFNTSFNHLLVEKNCTETHARHNQEGLALSHLSLQVMTEAAGATEFLTHLGLHKVLPKLDPIESWPHDSMQEDEHEFQDLNASTNFFHELNPQARNMSDHDILSPNSPDLVEDWTSNLLEPEEISSIFTPLPNAMCFDFVEESRAIMSYFRGESLVFSSLLTHPRIAQKSYGRERRFLSPQPLVIMFGSALARLSVGDNAESGLHISAYVKTNQRETRNTHASCQARKLEWSDGIESATAELKPCMLPSQTGQTGGICAIFRDLYVNQDADDKSMDLLFKVHRQDDDPIRVIQSNTIRVVSKPSKKKGPPKKGEATISYGSKIALFNRTRSQSINTRFLCVAPGGTSFEAKYTTWDTFEVHMPCRDKATRHLSMDMDLESDSNKETSVTYGSEIVLRHSLSKLTAAPFIVRPVSQTPLGQPVPQLQRLALEVRDHPGQYLAVVNDALSTVKCSRGVIAERALWMMVTVDTVFDSIAILPQEIPLTNRRSVISIQKYIAEKPTCTIQNIIQQSPKILRFVGNGFDRQYWVYFGTARARDVLFNSDTDIKVQAPFPVNVHSFTTIDSLTYQNQRQIVLVDLENSIVFPTAFYYSQTM